MKYQGEIMTKFSKNQRNPQKNQMCVKLLLNDKITGVDSLESEIRYYLLDCRSGVMNRVRQETFSKYDLPTISERRVKCKFSNGSRTAATQIINKARIAEKQGLCEIALSVKEYFNNVATGVTTILAVCNRVGAAVNLVQQQSVVKLSLIFSKICLICYDVVNFNVNNISFSNIIRTIIEMVSVVYDCKQLASPQSLESLLFAVCASMLPSRISKILKAVTDYTAVKVCDDINVFNKFIAYVMELLDAVCADLAPTVVYDWIKPLFKFGEHHRLLIRIDKLDQRVRRDKLSYLNEQFRQEVITLYGEVHSNDCLIDWSRTSASVKNKITVIDRLHAIVQQYAQASRQEPFCFAFEGKPGVRKSVLMTQLVQTLKKSTYTHSTRAAQDGKDFYDSYDNEELFVMDDVGQSGPSQFRMFFNFVAPVKMPLDCAAAHLKDTKFFTSQAIFFTTNEFKNLTNLTKADMINDVTALWRRVTVFIVSEDYVVSHTFDTDKQEWKEGFAKDVSQYMVRRNISIPKRIKRDNNCEVLGWLKALYNVYADCKKEQFNSNINAVDESQVDEAMNFYLAETQGWFDSTCDYALEFVNFLCFKAGEFFGKILETVLASANWMKDFSSVWPLVAVFGMVQVAIYVFSATKQVKLIAENNGQLLVKKISADNMSSSARVILSQTKHVKIETDIGTFCQVGVISGHTMLTADHAFAGAYKGVLTVFKTSREDDIRLIENMPFRVIWRNVDFDMCVISWAKEILTPFKNISHILDLQSHSKGLSFIHPDGVVSLAGKIIQPEQRMPYAYIPYGEERDLTAANSLMYADLQARGMCGSIVYSEAAGLVGVHVAGSKDAACGFALLLPVHIKNTVLYYMNDNANICNYDICETKNPESGVKLNKDFHCSNPKTTSIVRSPLFGLYPNYKEPANPTVNGPHTVKDSFKEALCHTNSIPIKELEEAMEWVKQDFPARCRVLSDYEVIKGTDTLASLAKDTATGVMLDKDRHFYVNFEEGTYTDKGKQILDSLEKACIEETVVVEDLIAKESVKIETRPFSKKTFPRTFRVLPMTVNLLLKKYLGNFVEKVIASKWIHGIMLSFNPYYEFHEIAQSLVGCKYIASDVKFWDKKMLAQVQHAVADWLASIVEVEKEEDRKVIKTMLYSLCITPVAVNDDTYLTTHSLPSGCYITTLFNSLVQKVYLAVWFKRVAPKNDFLSYKKNVKTFIMGDDILIGVKPQLQGICNAFSLKQVYDSFGLTLTNSNKGDIVEPFDTVEELTFLKRRIVFNLTLRRFVGLLDESTIYSTLNWVDSTKDVENVMIDKINVFQREIFLYPDAEVRLAEFFRVLPERYHTHKLTFDYLLNLYNNKTFSYETFDGVCL